MEDLTTSRESSVQEMRKAMGTLPSEAPELRNDYRTMEGVDIHIIDGPSNPYRAIFESSCATWGDDEYVDKWPQVSPANRFQVCRAALTGQTLPQAIEVVSFLFKVRGTPRWLFEEHAREVNQFITYLSVGCRDNSKLDASLVNVGADEEDVVSYFRGAKENYAETISEGQASWQSARALLPMSYHHPYLFYTSLLALKSTLKRFRSSSDFPLLVALLEKSAEAIGRFAPMMAMAVRGEDIPEDYNHESLELDRLLFSHELEGGYFESDKN